MRLNWSGPAVTDLRSIDNWLTENGSGELAARTLGDIGRRAEFLLRFPHGGRPMLGADFRVLRVAGTPFLLIYQLKADEVQLLRIRHEREDWQLLE